MTEAATREFNCRIVHDFLAKHEMNRAGFARTVKTSPGNLNRILNRRQKPKTQLAQRIATAVDKPLQEMYLESVGHTDAREANLGRMVDAYLATGGLGVYRENDNLWNLMERDAVTIIAATGPQAPIRWAEGMADRMQQLAEQEKLGAFQVYLLFDPKGVQDYSEMARKFEDRQKLYEMRGIGGHIQVYVCEVCPPTNLDFFIVDRKHIAIAVKGLRIDGPPSISVEFRNQPELAAAILDWFLVGARMKRTPFREWIKRHERRTNLRSISRKGDLTIVSLSRKRLVRKPKSG